MSSSFKDELRTKWWESKDECTGCAGWSLQTGHVKKGNPSSDELASLLDTIGSKIRPKREAGWRKASKESCDI
jgi:hypothetical protein